MHTNRMCVKSGQVRRRQQWYYDSSSNDERIDGLKATGQMSAERVSRPTGRTASDTDPHPYPISPMLCNVRLHVITSVEETRTPPFLFATGQNKTCYAEGEMSVSRSCAYTRRSRCGSRTTVSRVIAILLLLI